MFSPALVTGLVMNDHIFTDFYAIKLAVLDNSGTRCDFHDEYLTIEGISVRVTA